MADANPSAGLGIKKPVSPNENQSVGNPETTLQYEARYRIVSFSDSFVVFVRRSATVRPNWNLFYSTYVIRIGRGNIRRTNRYMQSV